MSLTNPSIFGVCVTVTLIEPIPPYLDCPSLQYFKTLHDSIVSSQPPERQSAMLVCFENLMDGIEYNLTIRNRDK